MVGISIRDSATTAPSTRTTGIVSEYSDSSSTSCRIFTFSIVTEEALDPKFVMMREMTKCAWSQRQQSGFDRIWIWTGFPLTSLVRRNMQAVLIYSANANDMWLEIIYQ